MRFVIRFSVICLLVALLSAGSAFAQRNSLEIRGDVQNPSSWSVDDVKKQFAEEILTLKNVFAREALTGIPLISLLKSAALKTEETNKHHELSFIVILEAYDGYRAYFTFAELTISEKENPVMLVWEEDGKPLPSRERPFRLFSTDSDRRIRGITSITFVDGIKLADNLK